MAIWPTRPGEGRQAILGSWDEADRAGFALFLDEQGAPGLIVGDGNGSVFEVTSDHPLRARQWVRLSARYHAETGRVRIPQAPRAEIGRASWRERV